MHERDLSTAWVERSWFSRAALAAGLFYARSWSKPVLAARTPPELF